MPVVESSVVVPVPSDIAFAVSQTTGEVRLRWDPFIAKQHFLDGALRPGKGVRTYTRHWSGLTMVSEYVSYKPPTNVGMKMIRGPWFFANLAGGWRFDSQPGDRTLAMWRYNFTCRPRWLAPVANRIGTWWLGRDIDRRIAGFAAACADPVIVTAAQSVGSGSGTTAAADDDVAG